MRVAIIDSSPLISFVHLGLADQLTLYFDVIYVPRAVQREVNCKHRFRYRLRKLFETGIYVKCMAADKWRIELLRTDVHEGEAEGLVQAQEKNAAVFIGDDMRARNIAVNQGLTPVGTARILARLFLEGRGGETTALVRKLRRDLRFRISDEIVQAAIDQASEPI